jgi:hypothetical protein
MKTLDHAFNADGLRKSGAKLEKAAEIRANLRTGWLRANKHETGVNKKSMVCAVPAQVRRVPWHAQPCVEEIQKQAYKKKKKITRYDIFELEGEERRTDKRRT